MKYAKYPLSPLTPLAAASRLHTTAVDYGIRMGANRGVPDDKSDQLAEATVVLAERVQMDVLAYELDALRVVPRRRAGATQ